MFSHRLIRRSHRVLSAALVLVCADVVVADSVLAQTVPDSGAVRGRVGGGGRGGQGPRMGGAPNGFDGATPQMFEAFFEKMMRERILLNDDQIIKWRAWNRRFDAERKTLNREERETRKMLQMQLSPAATPDEAKAADILERLGQMERKLVNLHERENKDLTTFMKPSQRLRFFALQDRVKRDMQEAQGRRDGGRGGDGNRDGRGGPMRGDTTKFRQGTRGDSAGGKFMRQGQRPPGKVDTMLVGKTKN